MKFDLKKIEESINSPYPDEVKMLMIIQIIGKSPDAFNIILNMLDSERRSKDELIREMNELLSKSHATYHIPEDMKKHMNMDKQINDFYKSTNMVFHKLDLLVKKDNSNT